jgi:fatty acid desaturase
MADPAPSPRRADDAVSLGEVVEYVKTYAKQETIGPLRGAGRWLAYGAAGALTLGLGAFFLLLGILRLVQTEWDRAATGRLSWLAYLIVFVITLAALALTLSRIRKSSLYPSSDDRSSRQEASR